MGHSAVHRKRLLESVCMLRCRITKVRAFQQLARLSEADGHLQQRIKQLLKLSKEKWDAACDHAKTAVQVLRPWARWPLPDIQSLQLTHPDHENGATAMTHSVVRSESIPL